MNTYSKKEDIEEALTKYYEEEVEKNLPFSGMNRYSEATFRNLQIKLLQTTQLFVKSFDYDLGTAVSLKHKVINTIKKIIRKMTLFITKPYAEKMLKFQESTCELLGQMIEATKQQGDVILNQKQMLLQYRNELESISHAAKELEKQNILLKEFFNQKKESLKAELFAELEKKLETEKSCKHENFELYKEDLKSCEEEIKENGDRLWKHEEAIYNVTLNYNESAKLLKKLSDNYLSEKEKDFKSYSQVGEDMIVNFLMTYGGTTKKGLSYLDIGCNHYKKLNNTFYFYEMGGNGVLVEANPSYIEDIKQKRPRDIVLNMGVGNESGKTMKFNILNNPDLSSFNQEVIENAIKESPWLKVERIEEVPIITINEIIEKYFFTSPTIVSLDVEGEELSILQAMDMQKYRPYIFIIETIEYRQSISIDNKRQDIIEFMERQDYAEYAFTGVNSIFVDKKQI